MKATTIIVPAVLSALFALGGVANANTVNQRLHNQHLRIERGIHSGELTYREQHRVEARDARIHHSEYLDRRHDKGHLTVAERHRLQGRLNYNSKHIYADKHNGSVRNY